MPCAGSALAADMTIIGMDLGGSGSRIAATDAAHALSGPAFAVTAGRADHATVVRDLARGMAPSAGRVEVVAACAAGLVALGDPESIRAAIAETWPGAAIVIASDAVGAVAGAWDEDGGGIVAAGTGSVAFATNFADVWARSDGWGHVLGDDGAAAWIGARGLSAGLRALDGRPEGSLVLLDALRETFGDPMDLPDAVRAAPNSATLLSSFAPAVTAAAADGDITASQIVQSAAGHLAETGLSVLRAGVPARLAFVGGLSQEAAIAATFEARVRASRPDVLVTTRAGTPLDGALELARRAAAGALPSHDPYLLQFPSPSPTNEGSS